jgi:hypothetical protein
MRGGQRPGEVFDALLENDQIVVHASDVERTAALADIGAAGDDLIIADTREQVGSINAVIRDRRRGVGEGDGEPVTRRGERIGLGDRVARRNDRDLGVANRDVWTVAGLGDDGSLVITGRAGERELPADFVREHVELAFASTAHGAQGETVDSAHLVIGEVTGAAAAYVGMTRGRHSNVAHLVAESVDDARQQWIQVFSRDRADLGPGHAATRVDEDIERYGAQAPRPASLQAAVLAERRRPEQRQPVVAPPRGPGIGR